MQGEKITFDEDAFIQSRPQSLQPFLEEMLNLQIFRQFVEERIQMLDTGKGLSDEFEKEAVSFSENPIYFSANGHGPGAAGARIIKSQYAQVKKEGGAFVKAVKSKVRKSTCL